MPAPPTTPPDSRRQIVLASQTVDYQLRRSRRRTIGLRIDQQGLRVSAPLRAPLYEIEKLIAEHGRWVLDKLTEWQERAPQPALTVGDGGVVFALGQALTVKISPAARAGWQLVDQQLQLRVPPGSNAAQVLEKALREHARQTFLARLAFYAPRLGVSPPPLRLSSARTRWGSCSQRGGIALNWRLVLMPLAVVDYVVCHELAHLREMNHSPRFWSVVEQLYPDWQAQRLELRRLGREIPVISC